LDDSRASRSKAGWKLLLPEISGFHHVVIHGDHQGKLVFGWGDVTHGATLAVGPYEIRVEH